MAVCSDGQRITDPRVGERAVGRGGRPRGRRRQGISRLAINAGGDRLAFVAEDRAAR